MDFDLRRSPREADCVDCLAALPVAIARMRAEKDDSAIPDSMIEHTHQSFDSIDFKSRDQVLTIAGGAQDHLYRFIASLEVMDAFTKAYIGKAIRYFFLQLSGRGVKTYYILDNALREDRLGAVLALFGNAGIGTATPRRDGKDWATLSNRIRTLSEQVGHVAYIEPDAEVNHIEAAKALVRNLGCIGTFRNLGPESPTLELIATGPDPIPLVATPAP